MLGTYLYPPTGCSSTPRVVLVKPLMRPRQTCGTDAPNGGGASNCVDVCPSGQAWDASQNGGSGGCVAVDCAAQDCLTTPHAFCHTECTASRGFDADSCTGSGCTCNAPKYVPSSGPDAGNCIACAEACAEYAPGNSL